jgi:hypothetical protein
MGLPMSEDRGEPAQEVEVAHQQRLDAGVLHLHGHRLTVHLRAVHLPDAGRREGALLEALEELVHLAAELGAHHLLHALVLHRRALGLQLGHDLARLFGHGAGQKAGHLPGLHDQALQLAHLSDHGARRLDGLLHVHLALARAEHAA